MEWKGEILSEKVNLKEVSTITSFKEGCLQLFNDIHDGCLLGS